MSVDNNPHSPFGIIRDINKQVAMFRKDHEEMLVAEEISLQKAREELSELDFLKFESGIVVKRRLREDTIDQLEKQRGALIAEMDKYLEQLKSKTQAAMIKRRNIGYKQFVTLASHSVGLGADLSGQYSKKGYVEIKLIIEDGARYPSSIYEFWLIDNFRDLFNMTKEYSKVIGGRNLHYIYFEIPASVYYDNFVAKNWNYKIMQLPKIGPRFSGNDTVDEKNAWLLNFFKNNSGILANSTHNLAGLLTVINACFPSVTQYIGNEASYPYFIDFAENVPWPNSEQIDMAIRLWIGMGTVEYAKANIKLLKKYADYNTKATAERDYSLVLPYTTNLTQAKVAWESKERMPEAHLGIPKIAKSFNYLDLAAFKTFHPQDYNAISPTGLAQVPVGKNISQMEEWLDASIPAYEKSINESSNTPEQKASSIARYKENIKNPEAWAADIVWPRYDDATREIQKARKAGSWSAYSPFYVSGSKPGRMAMNTWPQTTFPHVANETAKDWFWPRPKKGYLFVPGMGYINPSMWSGSYIAISETMYAAEQRRREWQAKFKPIQDFYEYMATNVIPIAMKAFSIALQFNMAALMGPLFGPAAGIASMGNVLISNTGLGDTDAGKILVRIGQAITIANITGAAVEEVIKETLENELYSVAKREIGSTTGLDKTAIGRVGLDLTAGTAFNMYKDKQFMEALTNAADKSWRLEAARSNPYAALIVAGVTEVEKNGMPDSMNPLDWVKDISVSDELKKMVKSIQGKDIAKLIGLSIMVGTGAIKSEDAVLMVGQEAAVRNIDRFYNDKPIHTVDTEYQTMTKDMVRWRTGIRTIRSVANGKPPTREDIMSITDNVATPIYDRIKALGLPTKTEVKVWDIALNDIGLPNIAQYVPDVNVKIPDWAKTEKNDGNWPIVSKKKIEERIGKDLTAEVELTRDDIVDIILSLLPRNTPLTTVSKEPVMPDFNFIDDFGKINIRDPLKFPYIHPMLKYNIVKRVYTEKEKAYMLQREAEIKKAREQMAKIQQQIADLNAGGGVVSQVG